MDNQEIRDTLRKKAADIPVPDTLQPDQIEEKLKNKTQNHPRFMVRRRSILTAAAAIAVLCVVGLVPMFTYLSQVREMENDMHAPIVEETTIADNEEKSGVTYDEIYDAITGYHKEQDKYSSNDKDGLNFMEDIASESEKSSGSAPTKKAAESISDDATREAADHSETDTQVNGVMEGDIVKTDGKHIFTVKEGVFGSSVRIYKAEGAHVEELSMIHLSQADCSELYIEGNTLIAIGNLWEEEDSNSIAEDRLWEDVETISRNSTQSHITLYDLSDPAAPEQIRQLKQSGSFNTSRISGGYVYTFTNYSVNSLEYKKDQPEEFVPKANNKLVPADKIRLAGKKGGDSYMVMTSLKLDDHNDFADSQAILGNFNTYYMNQEHIYAVNPGNWWEGTGKSAIVKYSYDKGKFSFCGNTKIRGAINDSYYMHEYKGNFVFVYTREKPDRTTNGLCVLDQNLKPIGEISDLGVDETIYSSYYIDNMAYFVTFRNTDPVFAVDISNPKKPVLKSELKLPGFSSYLHSLGKDKLIGIGSSSGVNDRVKLSLFSIGDDYKIREIDKKLEKSGSDSSESYAGDNHKCVFVDEERGLIGLAVETWKYDDSDETGATNQKTYYIVYRYHKGKLKKVLDARLSKNSSIENIRGLRIGEYFYIVDADTKGGIEVYDINTWKKAK